MKQMKFTVSCRGIKTHELLAGIYSGYLLKGGLGKKVRVILSDLYFKLSKKKKQKLQENNDILELLEGLVVQAETRVSRQVQLLKLGRQIFR